MNQVLILSDSHGLTTKLSDIKKRHQDVDHFIHCGDSELSEKAAFLSGYKVVGGNCDWNGNFPDDLILEVGGLVFYITHGHLYGVKGSLLNLQYRSEEIGADVVCFGHSHILYTEKINHRLFINPGSIRLPKQFPNPSYIILSWDQPQHLHVDYYDVTGERLERIPHDADFFFV